MSVATQILSSLDAFTEGPFEGACLSLWKTLGYESDRLNDGTFPSVPNEFWALINRESTLSKENASFDDWQSVHFLFQLADEDIKIGSTRQGSLLEASKEYDKGQIESFLFVAIRLTKPEYSRTQLSKITREVNRAFKMPVIVLFRHGEALSIAVIDRRTNKRDSSRDVIDGRLIAIIKDVRFQKPHTAHVKILEDFSFTGLDVKRKPESFRDLYEAWLKTLSVKELNKRFYRELANWYFWAVGEVKFPVGGGVDPASRNAVGVIRLITRIIFIWFLKERGLVSDKLFDPDAVNEMLSEKLDPKGTAYYKAILQNLFFATLNTEIGSRTWASQQSSSMSNEYLNPHAFRYEEYFKDSASALALFDEVPFLNGGLFECLDRLVPDDELGELEHLKDLIAVEKGKIRSYNVQRIDGFSRRSENPIHIPNRLFFQDDAVSVDRLNEVYDTSGRDYKVRGLFPILNSYKFTVDENTPVEEEVALDPELLGKVFENLLASYNPETQTTARKQTGSFYTPREIVDYMVDESLHRYFKDHLEGAGITGFDSEIRALLSYEDQLPELGAGIREELVSAVDKIKILDPACGSGAFPMGVLQKLVHFIGRIDPKNESWYKAQLERVERLRKATLQIEALDVREDILSSIDSQEAQVKEAFERDELNYMRKLFLIRNSIFGVDIQPIAVQISKLRVFISLLVSEAINKGDRANNYGVQPLPNLESKFVAANTLRKIEPAKQATLGMTDDRVEEIKRELKEVRESKFFPKNFAAKRKLIDRDRALRKELKKELAKVGFGEKSATLIAEWDPDHQNESAGFFDAEWMFMERGGFHIVIGNPPYMRVQGLQQTQPAFMPYYRDEYKSASGSFDIYGLFVERGLQLLGDKGQLVFILPHKFFQASFAIPLRQMLNQGQNLRQIVRFGAEQVFDEATTYTCLLFLARQATASFDLFEVKSLAEGRRVFDAIQHRQDHEAYSHSLSPAPTTVDWDFTHGPERNVLERMLKHRETLGGITRKVFVGLQTSADKLYVLEHVEDEGDFVKVRSKHSEQMHLLEKSLVKPFLMGKDVHRYETPIPRNVVIFPYRLTGGKAIKLKAAELETLFPVAWENYLGPYRDAFASREKGKLSGEDAFSYIYPKNLADFEIDDPVRPGHRLRKIMTPEIAARCEFTLDEAGVLYHTTKVYSLALKESWQAKDLFLLGVLNSRVLWFFLKQTGYVLRGGFYTFKTDYLKPFPIPESDTLRERQISILVQTILKLRRDSKGSHDSIAAISFFERLIDGIVYELYFPEDFGSPVNRVSSLLDDEVLLDPHISILGLETDEIKVIDALAGALANSPDKLDQTASMIYTIIQMPNHPIRRAIHLLDSIDSVRIIEEASK